MSAEKLAKAPAGQKVGRGRSARWAAHDHREPTLPGRVARRHLREQIKFLAIHEVAEQLGVSTRTVRRWIENLELVAHRFGRAVRIAERDLQAFIAMHRDD
ncbi:MAG: helix-turn-helix domain-containing protein [Burkholderiales bacterium]